MDYVRTLKGRRRREDSLDEHTLQPSRRSLAAITTVGLAAPALAAGIIVLRGVRFAPTSALADVPAPAAFNVEHVIASVTVFVILTNLGGAVASRLCQARVVGEIVMGLALGPSLLGAFAPPAEHWLHAAGTDNAVSLLGQIGIILFMFSVGRELTASHHRPHGDTATVLGIVMTAMPLAAGMIVATTVLSSEDSRGQTTLSYTMFVGLMLATTALPVLADIFVEHELLGSRVGGLTTGAVAVGDVLVWCLLAVTLRLARGGSVAIVLSRLAGVLVFAAVMWWVCRPLLRRALAAKLPGNLLSALLLGGLVSSALITDALGIQAIFGAFFFGLCMPTASPPVTWVTETSHPFTRWLLLPLFFVGVGSHTLLQGLATWPAVVQVVIVLLVALAGKFGVGIIVARVLGMRRADSIAVGAAFNCRGVTELLVLTTGLTAGLINLRTFAVFVMMTVVTASITGPVLGRLRLHRGATDPTTRSAPAGLPPCDGGQCALLAHSKEIPTSI